MLVKKILLIAIMILIFLSLLITLSYAGDLDDIVSGMKPVTNITVNQDNKIVGVINNVIFLIQVAGTGISLIVITMLGIKYVIASVEEKAEIKKQAMPILIGCILLFGAVNLVAIVANFADTALS